MNDKIICPNCKKDLPANTKFCGYCGTQIGEKTPTEQPQENTNVFYINEGEPFNKADYDSTLYTYGEDIVLNKMINNEFKLHSEYNNKTISQNENKKTIITILFSLVLILSIVIYCAYHLASMFFVIVIEIIIYLLINKLYKTKNYLLKQIKARPDEKISYVIASIMSSSTASKTNYFLIRFVILALSILIPTGLFYKPHIIYERQSDGYAVRYYTIGLIEKDSELIIPEKYKGVDVVSIRGDVFKNIYSIEKVTLPETLKEIRGGAFSFCARLESINIPSGITEIHGSTFEGCYNLKSIEIPEGVTRIGGSAFRDCNNLSEVTIPKTVKQIGSSAFRNTHIGSVCISKETYVHFRAFKESPTQISYYENNCEYVDNNIGDPYDYE